MRFILSFILLALISCKEQKKSVAINYLSKSNVFEKDSVRNFLNTVNEKQSDSSKVLFLKGIDLLKNGNNTAIAIDTLLYSLSTYPVANTYYELGNAYMKIQDWPMALKAYQMAEAMKFTPLGNVLFAESGCFGELDSTVKMYDYLKYAIQNGFVNREKILNNPHYRKQLDKYDGITSVYNEAMSGNGNPEEILWQGYVQDFKKAAFPYKVDSGFYAKLNEPKIISYDYEKFVPEMRDGKFSREVGSEYFYVAQIMQTEFCNVVLYGCRSYEEAGSPVYYFLASFNSKGKLIDKMVVSGAKNFDDNYKEFTAQATNHFQIEEFKNTYEKSPTESGYENNRVVSRDLIGNRQYTIDATGKFIPA